MVEEKDSNEVLDDLAHELYMKIARGKEVSGNGKFNKNNTGK